MKKKLVTIVLLSLMIALVIFGSVGSALAEEITLSLMSYQSEEISQEEIDFALDNLQYKLEVEELPRLIRVEEVYDFNEEPLYGLYEFDGYYMIVIRNTGSVLERGDGNSAYYGNNYAEKYYGGYEEYYVLQDSGFKNLRTGDIATKSKISQMQLRMSELRELDYQDYLEAMSTPMMYGEDNRGNITKLGDGIKDLIKTAYGKEYYLYDYFAEEINIDYQLKNNLNSVTMSYIGDVIYKVTGTEGKKYENFFWRHFGESLGYGRTDLGYDLFYPKNVYNQCSVVAMTMLLQYYYRIDLNASLLEPIEPDIIESGGLIPLIPLESPAEIIRKNLAKYVNVLNVDDTKHDGAATYVNIDAGFDRYFNEYGINCESVHFTSYTNIKAAINSGHPSIMTIGAGRGYDIDNVKNDLSGHNVVVYGYTTNKLGIIDEFVCHAGWHSQEEYDENNKKTNPECARLFVNKFYAAGNLHLSY